jgi:multidrug efflux system membrane fusion protein
MNPQLTRTLEKLAEPPAQVAPTRQKRAAFIPWLILIGLLGVAGFAAWKYWQPIQAYFTTPADSATGGGRRGAAGGIIPVVAATARIGVVHIYLDGLGQVTPLATVSLKTRVDGQIMKINYDEGQLVHEGDLLMEIDPRPYQVQLEQAQGQMLKDKALLNNAKLDLARYTEAGTAVSNQQLATQQALVDQYDATVVSDQSQIDAAQLQLTYCQVTSPITGRIGLRQVDVGNIVHASDTTSVAVITQLQPITVVFALPEDDLGQVVGAANGGVGLAVQAYDREDQHMIASGEVSAVDNQVDPTTGTFKVKATFPNQDSSLFPSEFVNAHLLADTKRNRILIPTAAVQHGPDGGAFVWLVKPNQTVTLTNVTESDGEQDFESVTGVQPGDVVVTDGTDKLQEGSKVTVTMTDFGTASSGPTTRAARGGRGAGRSSTRRSAAQ